MPCTPEPKKQPNATGGSDEYSTFTEPNVVQASEYLDRDSNDRVYGNDPVSKGGEVYLSEGQQEESVKLEVEEDAYSSDPEQEVKVEGVERLIHSEGESM